MTDSPRPALPFFGAPVPALAANPNEDVFQIACVLAQSAGRGRLTAEDLRTLMETSPRLVTTIAKNIPETWAAASTARRWRNLMRMAEEGRLTTAVLMRGLG